jgi:hypothetical protein
MRAKSERVRELTSESQPSGKPASDTGARGTLIWASGNLSFFWMRFTMCKEPSSGRALAIPSNPIMVAIPARIKPPQIDVRVRVCMICPPIHHVFLAVGFTLENSGNAPTGKYLDVAWVSLAVLAHRFPSELPSPSASRGRHPTSARRKYWRRLSKLCSYDQEIKKSGHPTPITANEQPLGASGCGLTKVSPDRRKVSPEISGGAHIDPHQGLRLMWIKARAPGERDD